MGDWKPERSVTVTTREDGEAQIHLWRMGNKPRTAAAASGNRGAWTAPAANRPSYPVYRTWR